MKLIIKNSLEGSDLYYKFFDTSTGEFVKKRKINQYDEKKWKNGSVYEFNTLKEMGDFINSCDIEYTEEYVDYEFSDCMYEYIDIDYYIDKSEDNLMVLSISSQLECRG